MTVASPEQLTRRLAQVEALGRLAHRFTESEDAEGAMQASALEGLRVFEAERAAVFIFDRPRGAVECRFSIGLSSGYIQTAVSRLRDYPSVAAAVQAGEPYFVTDIAADPDHPLKLEAAREGIAALAALPLRFAGEVIGSIALYHDQPRAYPPDERGIASAYAEIAALAIGKSRLLDQVSRIKREWQSAFDGTGSGLALVEATGHVSRGNRFLADLAGVPVTALPGLNIRSLFPAWPSPADDPLLQAIATNMRVSQPLEGRDGRHLVVTATPRPMGGLVVAVEDLTALVQLEERFTRLVQTAEDAIVIADPDGHLVFANRTACELFDRTSAELHGQLLDTLLPPDDRPSEESPPLARYTATVAHADGPRYAAVSQAPLEERGTRTGTVAVIRDVTRERHSSEALRRSEARFRALFAAAPLAIFTVSRDYRFQSVNHAAVGLAELGRRDRGRRVGDFIQPDELFQVEAHLAASFRGETRAFTFHVARLDGSSRVADAVAVAYDEAGNDRSVLLIARDVTDEVKLRERVTHSEKLAALGQLVSGVAHELNNPLAGIAALAQALSLDPAASQDTASVADSIRREAVRAARIVTELLTFARQRPLKRSETDLNQVIRNALAGTPRATEGARWSLDLDDRLPEVPGDAEQLQQVLTNLLLNATQSMAGRGGGEGVIRTWSTDRVVGCEVCDSGTGIAPDVLPKIFEPFFTTKGVGEGTGLGLSISHGIIRAHGGDIQVKNLATGGAAFWFELPRTGAPGKVING